MNATTLICVLVALVIGATVAYFVLTSQANSKTKEAERKISEAESQAQRITSEAERQAENTKRESVLAAKEEILKLRQTSEAEEKQRKGELRTLENRIMQREESLDKRNDALDKREHNLQSQQGQLNRRAQDLDAMFEQQTTELERISALSVEDAHRELLERVRKDTIREEAQILRESEQRTRAQAEKTAREIVTLAIQRCAADQAGEVTVTSVHIPSDDLKGRIIGREGRNIRTFEQISGVSLVIDDSAKHQESL